MTHFTFLVGRLIFGAFFVWHGIEHVRHGPMMTRYARMKGIAAPETSVLATGVMLIVGGASIVLGWRPDIGVALLVIFLVAAAFLMHNFWTVAETQARTFERVNFEKDLALAGAALMLLAIPRPWPFGVG